MRKIIRQLCVALAAISVGTIGLVLGLAPANAIVGGEFATKLGPNIAISGCSGTLLSREWAITAFHCAEGKDARDIFGLWGDLDWRTGTRVNASEVHHEGDIALIRLIDLPPEAVEFAALGDVDPPIGTQVTFFGWGREEFENPEGAPGLKTGTAEVITPFANGFGDAFGGPSWTVRYNGNGAIAAGDSGGGAYHENKLVGVVSNGDEVGGNFASVPAHRGWIKEVTGL